MGHAYYGNYMLWFEQARGAWCRDRGFTYKQLEDEGFKMPVVEVWVKYTGEMKYDDIAAVNVKVGEIKRAAIKFEYEVVNETTGKVATIGYSWHVFVNDAMKAISIPPHARQMLGRDPDAFETLA